MLRPEATSMRLTDEGILVEGSRGFVLLKKEADTITATAMGQRSKRTPGYAERLRKDIIRRAQKYQLPWTTRLDGSIQIIDQTAFYESTFDPTLHCLEIIKKWIEPHKNSKDFFTSKKI